MGDYVAQNSLNQTLVMSVFSFLLFLWNWLEYVAITRRTHTHTRRSSWERTKNGRCSALHTHTRSRPCSVREIVILVYLAQVKVSSRLVEKTKKTELRMVRVGEGFVFSLSLSLSLSCLLCFLPYSPGCVSDCWATELATSSHAWPSGQQTAAVVECV